MILDQSSNTVRSACTERYYWGSHSLTVQNIREGERDCNSPPTTQGHFRGWGGRWREGDRETERQTDRLKEKQRQRQRERGRQTNGDT